MQERIEQSLEIRVENTVDVPAVFQNCFFHSLALYYLLNEIPLPDDLFVKDDGDLPEVKKIKQYITCEASLALFSDYTTLCAKESDIQYPHFLYEKTIVLGVLFRSWFMKELPLDEEHKAIRFQNDLGRDADGLNELNVTFMSLIKKYRQDYLSGDLVSFKPSVEDNAIYLANQEIFQEFSPDNLEENEVVDKARDYWETQGYNNYCSYLAEKVKVSYADFSSLLENKLNIPFTLYNKVNASLIHALPIKEDMPLFELALNAQEGHYFLVKTGQISEKLIDEYAMQNLLYKFDREDMASIPGDNKVEKAEKESSLLFAAVIMHPNGRVSPLQLLGKRIEEMAVALQSNSSINEIEINKGPIPKIDKGKKATSQKQATRLSKDLEPRIEHFLTCIADLEEKQKDFLRRMNESVHEEDRANYQEAATAAEKLHEALLNSLGTFLGSDLTKDDYETFAETNRKEIATHRTVLAKHRDSNQLIGNIIGAIVGLGIFYGIALGINYLLYNKITFFQTDSEQKLDEIEGAYLAIGSVAVTA